MTLDAYAAEHLVPGPPGSSGPGGGAGVPASGLTPVLTALAEEIAFACAAAPRGEARAVLEGLVKRRSEVYRARFAGQRTHRMTEAFDAWFVDLTKALAPVASPVFLPMGAVVDEKVSLHGGARGLRSIFSSKPSDKEVLRVKRLGSLAVRVLRAVYAADGDLDAEDRRNVTSLVESFGLPDDDAQALTAEAPGTLAQLDLSVDLLRDLDESLVRGLVHGAWLAAAWDGLHPREEEAVAYLGTKLSMPTHEIEGARQEALRFVEERRAMGHAAVDGVRFVMEGSPPLLVSALASYAGGLVVPRRYRDEVLGTLAQSGKVTLGRRHASLSSDSKTTVLAMVWAFAHVSDPTITKRATLRSRLELFGADLGEPSEKARSLVDPVFDEVLVPLAAALR